MTPATAQGYNPKITPVDSNPYPGPRPFRSGEKIYGREREIAELYYLLVAQRIVLLHSPSGAGKSSMVNAGLIPRLLQRFAVWRPTRVNTEPPANFPGNRYIRSAILGFEEGLPKDLQRPASTIENRTLKQFVEQRPKRPGAQNTPFLIFDQFEEILTADPLNLPAKRQFFEQLGELLHNPRIWALFIIREDYLGPLGGFANLIPTHLQHRFRVDRLNLEAARDAIVKPAEATGRSFAPMAAGRLIIDLATTLVQDASGNLQPQRGTYIEPVQLQVVCRGLWDRIHLDDLLIDSGDIKAFGNVTEALAEYYAAAVKNAANHDLKVEREIREWFDNKLTTPAGIRTQVVKGARESGGVDNARIQVLRDRHVVSIEPRGEISWFELSHDRLVTPVRDNNAKWFSENLHLFQQQASVWAVQRSPALLLDANINVSAAAWAKSHLTLLTQIDKEFLAASKEKLDREKRTRRYAIAAAVLIPVALIALGIAYYHSTVAIEKTASAQQSEQNATAQIAIAIQKTSEADKAEKRATASSALADTANLHALQQTDLASAATHRAEQESTNATSLRLAATALSLLPTRPQLGALLALRAYATAPTDHAIAVLHQLRYHPLFKTVYTNPFLGPIAVIAHGGDVYLQQTGPKSDLNIRDTNSGALKLTLKDHTHAVSAAALSPGGKLCATGGTDGTIIVSDLGTGKRLWTRPAYNPGVRGVLGLNFSSDGDSLASTGDGGLALVHDARSGELIGRVEHHGVGVMAVAISNDRKTLATQNGQMGNNGVVLWENIQTTSKPQISLPATTFHNVTHILERLEFTGNDKHLLGLNGSGLASIYQGPPWSLQESFRVFQPENNRVRRAIAALHNSLPLIAYQSRLGVIEIREPATSAVLFSLHSQQIPLNALAFTRNDILVSADDNGTVSHWQLDRSARLGPVSAHELAFLPGGAPLAVLESDAGQESVRLVLHDVLTQQAKRVVATIPPARVDTIPTKAKALALNRANDRAAVISGNRILQWKLPSGEPETTIQLTHGVPYRVAYSPDGRNLATVYDKGKLVIHDTVSGAKRSEFTPTDNALHAIAFHPDGKTLAVAGATKIVYILDRASGKLLHSFDMEHKFGRIFALAYSPDGRRIAAATSDSHSEAVDYIRTVKIWDTNTGQRLMSLSEVPQGINALAFSADGKRLAIGSIPDFWDVDIDSWRAQACTAAGRNLTPAEWKQYVGNTPYKKDCPDFP